MKRKLIHLFLILHTLLASAVFSQTEIKNADVENYLQFKILESENETGKYVTGDLDQLGFIDYSGKQTLAALPSENRMLTLRSEFSINPNIEQEEWVIVVPPIFYACNIYLNGKLIAQRGDIKKGYTSRSHDTISILLSPDILNPNQKSNSLAIELLPKFGEKNSANGFFLSNRQTGDTYVFWRNLFSVDFIRAMALVSFVIFLYFLIFSFKRKTENTSYYIHFSLICLAFPLSYLNNIISYSFCDTLLLEKLSRFGLAFWTLLTPIYILEFTKVFKEYKNRITLALATIYLPFFVLGWLPNTVQGVIEFYINYTSLLALVTGAFAIAICFLFAYRTRTKYAIILSLLYILTIPSGAHDLYYFVVLQSKPYALLTPYIMFLVVIVFFFIVAWQHSEVYKLALDQSNELKHINENLEQIIKERTENLRLTEEKYHNLFLHSNLGTFHSNFEDRYIELNLTLAKMLGYDSPEEVMNSITSISKQIYAEPSRRDDLLTEALNKGGSISIENHYRRKDGSSWYGMLHLRIVFDKEGKPDYYEGFVEDITARKNIEQKLIESEEKYRSLINGLGEMMFRISLPNGKYEYVSPSVMQIYGYTQKDFLENPLLIMSIIHPDYAKYFYDNWMDLLQGNVAPLYEYKIIDRFGNEKWIQQSNKAIFNEEGNLIAIDGLCRDITKQKKSEIKILDQQQELEKLNEFTKIINSNSNITNILQEIYTYLRKETGFEIVWILLVSKKQDKLFSAENLSVFESEIEFDKDYFVNFRKKINESLGILYHTYQERIPFYCPDTTLSKRNITNHFTGKDYKLHQTDFKIQRKGHFKSMLQFPLILQNEVIGIINLTAHSKKVEISPSGINNMMRFADQIAGVIRNARLLEEAEEAKKEAEIEQRIAELARTETEQEKAKSEKLLLNILPEVIAKELKEQGSTKPVFYESVSVMFTDFKGFTKIAESLTPTELITELDGCFSYFDSLMERYNLEKLKTIGDSYMCAGGIPMANKTHAIDCILAALEIQSVMNQVKELKEGLGHPYWELRLGIHTGPLIAGVIGEKKFAYDVWGDTVNTASRMEASGIIGKVNISSATYELVKDFFDCEYRGKIQAKNKGEVEMYFVTGIKQKLSIDNDCKNPSYKFWMLHERVKNGETININDLEDRRKMEIPDIKKERRKKNKTKKVNQNEVEIVG